MSQYLEFLRYVPSCFSVRFTKGDKLWNSLFPGLQNPFMKGSDVKENTLLLEDRIVSFKSESPLIGNKKRTKRKERKRNEITELICM